MLFNSFDFLILFLPLVFVFFCAINFTVPRFNGVVLLLSSLFFYSYWSFYFSLLMLSSILFNFYLGRYCSSRSVVIFGVFVNLSIIVWFKYLIFLTGIFLSAQEVDRLFGLIILPLGISFYTFQQISYLVDMYRGSVTKPSFTSYAAYVSFFPQLVAGPIIRYHDIDRQISRLLNGISRHRLLLLALSGFALFCLGLFKKVVIADSLSLWVDPVFSTAGQRSISTLDAWIGSLAYSFQLYFDFSGYSDMALGLGRMFGLIFPLNFNSPYKSLSISEFWRRWHMSLSFFVRDYIYIPLGGSREGYWRQVRNLFLAFLLIGIWHGAGYTFLVWGIFHGALVTISQMSKRLKLPKVPPILAWFVTFILVVLGWVVFRSESLSQAFSIYSAMFGFGNSRSVFPYYGQSLLGCSLIVASALIALLMPNTNEILGLRRHSVVLGVKSLKKYYFSHWYLLPLWVGAALYFALSSLGSSSSSFLYFNF